MPAITITRLFGSGGSEVARRVAEALGWQLVDSVVADGIAKGLRATPAAVETIDERAPTLAERLADAFALGGGEVQSASLGTPMPPTEQKIAEVTREVIDRAVARGPSVVVGRGTARIGVPTAHLHPDVRATLERVISRRVAESKTTGAR